MKYRIPMAALAALILSSCMSYDREPVKPDKRIELAVRTGTVRVSAESRLQRDYAYDSPGATPGENRADRDRPVFAEKGARKLSRSMTLSAGGRFAYSLYDSEVITLQVEAIGNRDAELSFSDSGISQTYVVRAGAPLGLMLSAGN